MRKRGCLMGLFGALLLVQGTARAGDEGHGEATSAAGEKGGTHESAGHEADGHEAAGHDAAGHEAGGHDGGGHDAARSEGEEHAGAEHAAGEHAGEHHGGHHVHANHAALFAGAVSSEGETLFTVGLDYERRFSPVHHLLGVAVFGEVALAEEPIFIAGGGLVVHPFQGLKLMVLPAAEIEDSEAAFLLRLAAAYDIHVGRVSLTPTLATDYAHSRFSVIYGLGIGIGF